MDALATRPRPLGARALFALIVLLAAFSVAARSALASVADEQLQGQKLAEQVRAGDRSCKSLSAEDLDHIGEFVMGRMVGSTSAHEAMNARMTAVLGASGESRMHQVLGARFVGCASSTGSGSRQGSGAGMMGGQGMMGSGSSGWNAGQWQSMMGPGSWGSMMRSAQGRSMMGSSGDWSWMMGSGWKSMSDRDWQNLQRRMVGLSAVRATSNGGWQTRDYLLAGLVVLLAAALTVAVVLWRPWRR